MAKGYENTNWLARKLRAGIPVESVRQALTDLAKTRDQWQANSVLDTYDLVPEDYRAIIEECYRRIYNPEYSASLTKSV